MSPQVMVESVDIGIDLTTDNINFIYQQSDLCSEPLNCYIVVTDQTATDIFSNQNEPISTSSALNVTNFASDISSPELVIFLE